MPFNYTIEHDDSCIRVRVTGTPDYLSTDRLWHDIVAHCKRTSCHRVLGESATEEWHDADAYDHAPIFEAAGISNSFRVAWVENNPEAREAIKLTEAVVNNRGFETARSFDNIADAKRWLDETPGND
ncbi:MAG: hypothetical protein ACR2RD_09765 [Woeseiaceae bacterium]